MKKLAILIFIITISFLPKLAQAQNEANRQKINNAIDKWYAGGEIKPGLKTLQEEAKAARDAQAVEREYEQKIRDQIELNVAKRKEECESVYLNWGKTQDESENSCRKEVKAARKLAETPPIVDPMAQEERDNLERAKAALNKKLSRGDISEGGYNKEMHSIYQDYNNYMNERINKLKDRYEKLIDTK